MEAYFSLKEGAIARGEFVDRKSRFVAELVCAHSKDEAAAHLAKMRALHYDARHCVSAWILADGQMQASDDGEPSRTSGLPSLEVLRGAELKDVCVVVARYFGGILLGPGGLVRAYESAVRAAVDYARDAGLVEEFCQLVELRFAIAYKDYERICHQLQQMGGKVYASNFAETVRLRLRFKAGDEQEFLDWLQEFGKGQIAVEISEPMFAVF